MSFAEAKPMGLHSSGRGSSVLPWQQSQTIHQNKNVHSKGEGQNWDNSIRGGKDQSLLFVVQECFKSTEIAFYCDLRDITQTTFKVCSGAEIM